MQALLLSLAGSSAAIRLTTSTSLPVSVERAHSFLATPKNWPDFVLSSVAVRGDGVDAPFSPGKIVDEIFGLPPILPLEVSWQCVESEPSKGVLKFAAPQGLANVATDCTMEFAIAPVAGDSAGCTVDLEISYEPTSPIAIAAVPVLNLDNAFAVKVGLPAALRRADAGPKSKLGTTDPIAGPLVAAARRVGLMPEQEADGWTGEPSAWAEADSVPQRLSEVTQQYLGGFKQFVAEQVAGDYDKDAADRKLDELIADEGVTMFSFTNCPFCKQAKELLADKGVTYTLFELDEDEMGAGLRARLGARCGRTSVPSVWINGECIGGLNDGNPGLVPLEKRGELEPKLRAAGVMA